MTIHNLKYLFSPSSIVIIGDDSEVDNFDIVLHQNLLKGGFAGPVMLVNPNRYGSSEKSIYKNLTDLPEVPDLAIITQSLEKCPDLIYELGIKGSRAIMIVNNKLFRPSVETDFFLAQAILDAAKPYLMRILGPCSLGMAAPTIGINATILKNTYYPLGRLAVITESSDMMRTIISWTQGQNIGFSYLIPLDNCLDVDHSDILDYLAQDNTHTRIILMYLKTIRNPRKFMAAARATSRLKPVLVLKPRVLKPRNYGDELFEDTLYDAAFRRAGLLRVDNIEQLLNTSEMLASDMPRRKNRLIIVGNSRSIALFTADELLSHRGVLASISAATQTELASFLPPSCHTDNPVDLGDYAGPREYNKALKLLLNESEADSVLIIRVPVSPDHDKAIAQIITEHSMKARCSVILIWIGITAPIRQLFWERGIATYTNPSEAISVFLRVAEYISNREMLMETPPSIPQEFIPDVSTARQLIAAALADGRQELNGREVNGLLAAYEVPMVPTQYAVTPEEAAGVSHEFGQSVVLKILSPDIPEKLDVGGVAVALDKPEEVLAAGSAMLRRVAALKPAARIEGFALQPVLSRHGAYEVAIGVRTGRHFGGSPVLFFGHGGTEAQAIDDVAYALPPLNMHLARELMSRTRLYGKLSTSAGRPADLETLALTLIKVSQMVVDLAEIVQLDINPLWVSASSILGLDARVQIAEAAGPGSDRLAIRPYPKELEQSFELPDGRILYLRPILPEDEPALQAMVRRMPEEDVRLRFFQPIKELTHDMAARLTQLDYDREMAFVVSGGDLPGKARIWGGVWMTADPDLEKAEYMITLDRTMTGLGLGPMLMRCIIDYARQRGVKELFGEVLQENEPMLKFNRAFGFTVKANPDEPGLLHVTLKL